MRRNLVPPILVTLLLLAPIVGAFTFSGIDAEEQSLFQLSSGDADRWVFTDVVQQSGSQVRLFWVADGGTTTGLVTSTYDLGASSGGAETAIDAGYSTLSPTQTSGVDAVRIGNVFFGCYWNADTADTIKWFRSDNAGATWVTGDVDATTGKQIGNCKSLYFNATTWVVVWDDQTDTRIYHARTTDAGGAWTKTTVVDTAGLTHESLSLAARNSTDYALTYSQGTPGNFCLTTVGGTSWSCSVVNANMGAGVSLSFIEGDTWSIAYCELSSNDIKHTTNTNDGTGSWPSSTVVSGTECFADDPLELRVNPDDADERFVHWNGGGGSTAATGFRTSTDGGTVWSSTDTCDVSGTITAPSTTNGGGNLALLSSGIAAWTVRGTAGGGTAFIAGCYATVTDPILGADALIAVVDLIGMDVDRFGDTVITKHIGQNAKTWTGGTLGTLGTADTDCDAVDHVMSTTAGVAYIKCEPANDPDFIYVRGPTLEPLSYPGCDHCNGEISLEGFSSAGGDGVQQIGEIIEFPIDQSNQRDPGFLGADVRLVAFAFSSTGGKIGANFFANRGGGLEDIRLTVERTFPTATVLNQLCSWTFAGTEYVGGTQSSSTTHVYEVRLSGAGSELTGEMIGPIVFPAGRGIGCGQDKVLVGLTDQSTVRLYDIDTGLEVWTKTGVDSPTSRGVALSDDAKWAAYKDGDVIKILNALTGTETGSVTVPSGTWHSMKMDATGQNLWVATDDFLARYRIVPFTTVTDVAPSGGTEDVPPEDEADFLGGQGAVIGDALGVGEFGGNIFMGFIMIAFVAIGSLLTFRNLFAAAIGAVLGFALAWGFGYFDVVTVFALVVICAVILGLRLFRGSSGEA